MRKPETGGTSATYAEPDTRRPQGMPVDGAADGQAGAPGATRQRCATGSRGQAVQTSFTPSGGRGAVAALPDDAGDPPGSPDGSGGQAAGRTHVSGNRPGGLAITGRVPNAARRIDPPAMTEHLVSAVRGGHQACRHDAADVDGVPPGRPRRWPAAAATEGSAAMPAPFLFGWPRNSYACGSAFPGKGRGPVAKVDGTERNARQPLFLARSPAFAGESAKVKVGGEHPSPPRDPALSPRHAPRPPGHP